MDPLFFETPADFRKWLDQHHADAVELWVGYYKKDSGRRSITWPESVDEALCYGWIDGLRKSIDETSYRIRFSPRRKRSIWSAVNIRRAEAMIAEGRMRPAGLKAYEARRENRSGVYSYEQRGVELAEPYQTMLKKNRKAWNFFHAQPDSYKKAISWWIICARKEETRLKRLEKLADHSARGLRIPTMTQKKTSR